MRDLAVIDIGGTTIKFAAWKYNELMDFHAVGTPKSLEEFYENDERNSLAYTQMLVDAQTGEIIGQSDAADRSMFPGFLSWEDVNK